MTIQNDIHAFIDSKRDLFTNGDHATRANVFDEVLARFAYYANILQISAESNERYALATRNTAIVVENFIDAMAELAPEIMESDAMQDLAKAFDIELTKEFSVTVTMTYNLTITAPRNAERREIEHAITWEGNPKFSIEGCYEGFELAGSDDLQSDYEIVAEEN